MLRLKLLEALIDMSRFLLVYTKDKDKNISKHTETLLTAFYFLRQIATLFSIKTRQPLGSMVGLYMRYIHQYMLFFRSLDVWVSFEDFKYVDLSLKNLKQPLSSTLIRNVYNLPSQLFPLSLLLLVLRYYNDLFRTTCRSCTVFFKLCDTVLCFLMWVCTVWGHVTGK